MYSISNHITPHSLMPPPPPPSPSAYKQVDLLLWFSKGLIPPEYHMFLDEAYSSIGGDQHLTPYSAHQLRRAKSTNFQRYEMMLCFNNFLSSHRITIERAFGIFCRKWGILWRTLDHTIPTNSKILKVCAKLHNFSIDHWVKHGAKADQIEERARRFSAHVHDSRVFQSTGRLGAVGGPLQEDQALLDLLSGMENLEESADGETRPPSQPRRIVIETNLHDRGIFYSGTRGTNGIRLATS
jgi:hypothetical protein